MPQTGDVVESGPWKGFEVIHTYGDAQALEDGELVDLSAKVRRIGDLGRIPGVRYDNARCTRSIFATFAELARKRPDTKPDDVDETAVNASAILWHAVARRIPDEDGWRKTRAIDGTEDLGEVWLIPNELEGLTLMFPNDY